MQICVQIQNILQGCEHKFSANFKNVSEGKKIKIRPKHEQNLTLCILSWPAVLRDPRFAARWLNAH